MKKRINLLKKTQAHELTADTSGRILRIATIASVLLFSVFIVFSVLTIRLQIQKRSLQEEKKAGLSFLLQNQELVSKMAYFSGKSKQLRTFLADDADFLPYYTVLKNAISQATTEPQTIEAMKIDKDRTTDFTLRFRDYEAALAFIQHVENEDFLMHFDELTLIGFTVKEQSSVTETDYLLQFHGVFAPLTDEDIS